MNYYILWVFLTAHFMFFGMEYKDTTRVPSLKIIAAGAVIDNEPQQTYDFTKLPHELNMYVKDIYALVEQIHHTVPPILFDPKIAEDMRTFLKEKHKKFLEWKKIHDEWRDVAFSPEDLELVEFVKKYAFDIENYKYSPLYERGKALIEVLQNLNRYSVNTPATHNTIEYDLLMPLMAITPPSLRKGLSKEIWHEVSYYESGIAIMKNLLARGFNINANGRLGETALFKAAYSKNFALVRFLVEHGARVNNGFNDISWIMLLEENHKSKVKNAIVQYLQEQGAVTKNIQECTKVNNELLFVSIQARGYEIVKTLLTEDILLPASPRKHSLSVFYWAARIGDFDILVTLFTSKRFNYATLKKDEYKAALHVAQRNGYNDCAQLLEAHFKRYQEKETRKQNYNFNVPRLIYRHREMD